MNILLVNPEYPYANGVGHGGIATYTYTQANALSSLGHNVGVIAREGTIPDHLHTDVSFYTIQHQSPNGLSKYANRFRDGLIIWEEGYSRNLHSLLTKVAFSKKIDIVEIPEYGGLGCMFKNNTQCKVIAHFHTPTETVDKLNGVVPNRKRKLIYSLEHRSVSKADAHKATSHTIKDIACDLFNLDQNRVQVIKTPISTAPFDRISDTVKHQGRFDILFVGRLERRKGADILLKATREILQLNSKIHITIAGETQINGALDYRAAIERTLDDEERRRVWFLGPVTCSELPLLYRRSSLFIMPSIFENAPNALLEAMAARLPVVASNVPGIVEIIQHEKNGLLFSPGKEGSGITSCIKRLLDSPGLGNKLSSEAYKDVKNHYHPELIASQTLAFYESVLHNKG